MIIEILANTGRHCVRYVISRLFVVFILASNEIRGDTLRFIGTMREKEKKEGFICRKSINFKLFH